MKTYTIDKENSITAFASKQEAGEGETFSSQQELASLVAEWPADRLIEVWNGIPGLTPVKKFTDRKSAVSRIWKAIQSLDGGATEAARSGPTSRRQAGKRARRRRPRRPRLPRGNAPQAATSPPQRATAARRPRSWACSNGRTARHFFPAPRTEAPKARLFVSDGRITRRTVIAGGV